MEVEGVVVMVGSNSDAEVVTIELSVKDEVPPQSSGKDSPNIEPSMSVL